MTFVCPTEYELSFWSNLRKDGRLALRRHIASECIYGIGHPLHLCDRQIIHRCEGGSSSSTNLAIQIQKHKYRNSVCLKFTPSIACVGQWRCYCKANTETQMQSQKYWNTTHLYDGEIQSHAMYCWRDAEFQHHHHLQKPQPLLWYGRNIEHSMSCRKAISELSCISGGLKPE